MTIRQEMKKMEIKRRMATKDEILEKAREIRRERARKNLHGLIETLLFGLFMVGFGILLAWFFYHIPTNIVAVGVCNFPEAWMHYLNASQFSGCYFKP